MIGCCSISSEEIVVTADITTYEDVYHPARLINEPAVSYPLELVVSFVNHLWLVNVTLTKLNMAISANQLARRVQLNGNVNNSWEQK
jgi:hypothetical protein